MSEHTAPFDALVYVLDGEADIVICGKLYHPKEGNDYYACRRTSRVEGGKKIQNDAGDDKIMKINRVHTTF